jgi:hypothetical protein
MARARHGMCESNTAALCKSNGKDTIYTLSGTAWQGNAMGTAWARHGMCELTFKVLIQCDICVCVRTKTVPNVQYVFLSVRSTHSHVTK